jgi:predicted transcriptional regulator
MTDKSPKPLNFQHIEALREHLLLRVSDLAALFGVSRMTYYSWVQGKATIRSRNAARVRRVLRTLVRLVRDGQWPTPEVVASTYDERVDMLTRFVARDKNQRNK